LKDHNHITFDDQKSWPSYEDEYYTVKVQQRGNEKTFVYFINNTLKALERTQQIKHIVPSANA